MRYISQYIAAGLLVVSSAGCDKKESPTESSADSSPVGAQVEKALDEAAAEAGAEGLFDKELRKRACEILSPQLVASTFDVPEAELKQHKIAGCIYSWSGGDQIVEARFTTIIVHKTTEHAKTWFQNATKGMSTQEAQAQIDQISKQVTTKMEEKNQIDPKTTKQVTDLTGGMLAGMGGEEGFQFEDIAGVGDEARFSLSDGVIYVRKGNAGFVVGAYKGAQKPPLDMKGVSIKEMPKKAMAEEKAWVKKTLDARKRDAKKLALGVVAALR